MNYALIRYNDISNGTGVRTSIYVSGCRNACEGCFNQQAWDFHYGQKLSQDVIWTVIESLKYYYISGLSILGGEPLDPRNVHEVNRLINDVRRECPDKTIWLYTGFRWEHLTAFSFYRKVLSKVDVVVDGRFDKDQKDITLQYRGSSNQRIIDSKRSLDRDEIVLADYTKRKFVTDKRINDLEVL